MLDTLHSIWIPKGNPFENIFLNLAGRALGNCFNGRKILFNDPKLPKKKLSGLSVERISRT
jgi:hypothetical protein